MARLTALAKTSSELLGNPAVAQFLKEQAAGYALFYLTGGGKQINQAFDAAGYKIEFGPLGRVTTTFQERQLARDILERNQAEVQDDFTGRGVPLTVIIPVVDKEVGGVLTHINGDLMPIMLYNGFDKFFVLTMIKNVEAKRHYYQRIWSALGATGFPSKIQVVGFDE